MTLKSPSIHFLITFAFLAAISPVTVSAAAGSPLENEGRKIYFFGASPSGPAITGYFGRGLIEIQGQGAACAGCHGYDGKGRPESGIEPTNITWKYLMKSGGHIHPDGTVHPAFTKESLRSYLRDGIYPGGKRGDPAMPVYDMSDKDMDALIAYLSVLGTSEGPGVDGRVIRVGTILPSDSPPGSPGEIIERSLRAYIDDINGRGGIYNRRLELSVEKLPSDRLSHRKAIMDILDRDELFCLIGTYTPESDRELSAAVETARTPLIGPLTLNPPDDLLMGRYGFYLFPGLKDQLLALASFSQKELGLVDPGIALLYPSQKEAVGIAGAVAGRYRDLGWKKILTLEYRKGAFDAAEALGHLRKNQVRLIVHLGSPTEVTALMGVISEADPPPLVLLSGILTGTGIGAIPPRLRNTTYLAYPAIPGEVRESGKDRRSKEAFASGAPEANQLAKLSAYAAVKVLEEVLRRSGRDLSRERFIETLEGLRGFETGLTPPITFGKNIRTGLSGAYIVVTGGNEKTTGGTSLKGWFPSR
ncbi:MAG: ABC transporter substrate-binding protein [Nitrospirae bacterium]|nr:ABC transporter substrate-binding protein [Nitrospirota bacterium]